ncbi:MAG: glycosyl hydrolase family 28-related protein [Sporomusaceae bacterium]|nr:glycosyl hydrolase family 28-related protein [Sporomusaceae bacterium]
MSDSIPAVYDPNWPPDKTYVGTVSEQLRIKSEQLRGYGLPGAIVNAKLLQGKDLSEFILIPGSLADNAGNILGVNTEGTEFCFFPFPKPGTGTGSSIYLNVQDYGAKGDGTSDDTAAIASAIQAAVNKKHSLFFPSGTYLTDTQTIPNNYYNQFNILGEGRNTTILKKISPDGSPVLMIGTPSQSSYIANLAISDLTFQGIAGNTQHAIVAYDLVRSEFRNICCKNAINGFSSYGGISLDLYSVICDSNQIGFNFDYFASTHGGGWPNLINLYHPMAVNNSKWGVKFNKGRVLNILNGDIEGNGAAGDSTTGGIYVSNVGAESNLPNAIGISIEKCWFEGNAGDASIVLNDGNNTIEDCYFVANANATYDVHVIGGRYELDHCEADTNKAANLKEESGVYAGKINYTLFPNISYDPAKTVVFGDNQLLMRSGSVPVIPNLKKPLFQTGYVTTDSSGNATISFSVNYASGTYPIISTSVWSSNSNAVFSVNCYGNGSSGFSIHVAYSNGTSVQVGSNISVHWTAMGQGT